MITQQQILNQLHSLRHTGFAGKLAEHAKAHGFSPEYFYAIASRETNCLNILGDPRGGQMHGVGIIQIDIQHPIALKARDSGSYKTDPDPLLEFGAAMLAGNIAQATKQFPNMSAQQHLKVAASGYNCGMGNAIAGVNHGDSDIHTTGHDYGRDVMTRMAIFEELIAAGNQQPLKAVF